MRLVYHVMSAPSPLGLMFMAATERGLRYLEYLDRRSLKRAIAAHAADNPGATWVPSVRELRPLADLLEKYFCGAVRHFSTPLDPVGSEFQLRVWRALSEIPYGQTRTYGDVARAIGEPKAARAVGLACNQNPLVIVTPCHRVIGADGKLVGYAGGVPRKKALLTFESRYRDMMPLEGDRVIAPITVKVARPVETPRPAVRARRGIKPAKAPKTAVAVRSVATRSVAARSAAARPARPAVRSAAKPAPAARRRAR